ncbi:hypothetical protein E2562_036066 [Oryza meyeriana var. granulata]|uniref:Uncharacterized protein n=1 Tax=Oryza meyeriana var. granulata TaxID=110450 RepID=A0A6G1DAL3_9ORYZ|nr:hypothetical protein E2562_036066 [Oryza meyeriana var. granulata]
MEARSAAGRWAASTTMTQGTGTGVVSGLRREWGTGVDGNGEAYDDKDVEHKKGKDRGTEGGREDGGIGDDGVDAHRRRMAT